MTVDPATAGPFYTKVTGWKSEPWASQPSYTIFSAPSGPVAGMSPLPEANRAQGARGAWMTFIGAEDVDAAVSQAEKLGAKVLRAASDMAEVGRIAIVADPHGASFGLFKPLQSSAPKGAPQLGELAWHELSTPGHPEVALKFYQDLLGWQLLQKMDMGPMGFYYIFGADGVPLGGVFKPSQPTPGPAWLAYVEVPDADKAAATATKAGGHVLNGPMDVPGGGRIAQLSDPHGVPFAVHAPGKAAAASPPSAPKPSTPPKPTPPKPAPPKPAPAAKPSAPASTSAAPAKTPPAKTTAPKPKKAAPAKRKPAKKASAKKAPAKKSAPRPARRAAGKKKAARKAARKVARKVARAGKRKSAARKAKRGGKKARRKK